MRRQPAQKWEEGPGRWRQVVDLWEDEPEGQEGRALDQVDQREECRQDQREEDGPQELRLEYQQDEEDRRVRWGRREEGRGRLEVGEEHHEGSRA